MAIEIVLIAFGVAGIAWLFAGSRTSTARTLWSPGDKVLTIFRLLLGTLTVYVLLSAGGFARILGLIGAFFGGLHLYFTRPDNDLGWATPWPIKAVTYPFSKLEKLLIGK